MASSTNERSPLLVVECSPVPASKDAKHGPQDRNQADNKESECRPVNELAASLVLEDGQQTETDDQCSSHVSLRVPNVTGCGRLQEQEREEDKDLCNDSSLVCHCVEAECLEGGNEEEHNDESVVQAEGQMNQNRISEVVCRVMNLERPIAVRDSACDEKHNDECKDSVDSIVVCVQLCRGQAGVDSIEDAKTGEAPSDTVHDMGRSSFGELVDDHAQEKGVDERPYSKDPARGGEVGFLDDGVCTDTELGIDIARGEKDVGNNVDDFE